LDFAFDFDEPPPQAASATIAVTVRSASTGRPSQRVTDVGGAVALNSLIPLPSS
jgi:hypothetical protein